MMKRISVTIIFGLVLFISACDPGIRYEPNNWSKVPKNRWSKSFGDIDIETVGLGGLIGETWLDPELTVSYRGKVPLILESAILRTGTGEYASRPPRDEWGKWAIGPGTNQRLDVEWEFNHDLPIYKVLKDPVEMVLKFKVGNEETLITVSMNKST
jgi:hypothetical protein